MCSVAVSGLDRKCIQGVKEEKTNVNLITFKCAEQEEDRETKLVERYLIYWNIGFRDFSFGLCATDIYKYNIECGLMANHAACGMPPPV